MRRILPILVGVALLACLVYAFWPAPVPVDLERVMHGPLEITVDEEGKTRIKKRYVVSSPIAGRLRRIELDEGDEVVAGSTVIAVIEPSDPALLDARTLAEAEARVKAAKATVGQAEPNLERARAELDFALSEQRRTQELAERDHATKQEQERADLLARTRAEELKAAEFAARIAQFELELAEAALSRSQFTSESDVPKIEIRSPIDGQVLRVLEESAGYVTPGTELIEVGDPSQLEVVIDVLSSDAVKIRPGALVRLEHWGGDRPLAARVRRIEPAGFTKISALGVEEQRVNVIADFVDDSRVRENLGDGFRVEARIVVWRRDNTLKVPSSALFRQQGQWAVFRVNGHRARFRSVTIGRNNGLEGEVLAGLAENDAVVAHPSDKVVDGVRVVQR